MISWHCLDAIGLVSPAIEAVLLGIGLQEGRRLELKFGGGRAGEVRANATKGSTPLTTLLSATITRAS
jgi:hypothetical protein